MTMVAACLFKDGGVIIADSRATLLDPKAGKAVAVQDVLQKILPINRRLGLAYAGDVSTVGVIARHVRQQIKDKPRLGLVGKLAVELPRIARHNFAARKARGQVADSVDLVLFGVGNAGAPEIWFYSSPDFQPRKLQEGFMVTGSGNIVAPYLAAAFLRIEQLPDLKARADQLLTGLSGELARQGIDSVGGMFQIVTIEPGGIRPLIHGFMELNPEGPGKAVSMDIKGGKWFQTDLATGGQVSLSEPTDIKFLNRQDVRMVDFHPPPPPGPSKWHLTTLLTCHTLQASVGRVEFTNLVSRVGHAKFPMNLECVAAFSFWGPNGKHAVELFLTKPGERVRIYHEEIVIEFFPEEFEMSRKVILPITTRTSSIRGVHRWASFRKTPFIFWRDQAARNRGRGEIDRVQEASF
ncbi:MAG: hypothetical protein IPP68_12285 [Elusimicrobia bacterium]|nr:hypothetical protein [Elusimicrobiota bacterium]